MSENMQKIRVQAEKAPKAIGPYSHAVRVGNFVFCSGQVPVNPETQALEAADIQIQTRRALKNVEAVLEAAGSHPTKIIKTTVFLTDLKNFEVFNKEYEAFFQSFGAVIFPARSTIEVSALPRGSMVEIEALATLV